MLIALAATQSVTISTSCTCAQMLTEADCGRRSGCSWDTTKKACAVPTTPTTPTTETVAVYCDQYTVAADCAGANPCSWNGTTCTHFTGCTAFTQTSNDKCQEISTRCITDGVHCIEKDACSTYKTQTACVVNKIGRYCYWNLTDPAAPKCEDADDCPKLPATLNTDALCRAQLSKCTANAAGGCVESGTKCEDQVAEVGCVNNKDRTQACFWTSGRCLDKTCDNALLTLTTDQACKDFVSTCTTKQGGGCITRTTCGAATNSAACVTDNTGADCFWNGNACVNKTCANALATNKTNASCQTYLAKCITTGAGCVDNTGCDAAKIKDACDKTLTGTQCHWDGAACKVKNCTNAGSSYAGHDQCTTFMATCTANGASGCQDRTCANAPTTNNTNDLCKAYHPTGNCVTKNGGGCRTNSTCEAIDLESACVADLSGKTCFWDGTCKTKICTSSPTSNNTHALCSAFITTCTVGSGSTCVDKTCENIQAEENCSTDLNNKPCQYKGKCYKKQCALASKNISTHSDCQGYSPSCTLDNSGTGCMDLPLKCEAITNINGCFIKKDGGKCGLQGTSCVDQSCATAPADGTSYITTVLCNGYKSGCVVNNNLNGCIDLPATCAGRQKSENCEVEQARGLTHKCEWDALTNSASPVCIDVKCENAHLVTLNGSVTQNGCWGYKTLKCVINSSNTCIPRPKTCAGLVEAACKQDKVLEGDKNCYWDGGSSSCKDIACTSITFANGTYTHDLCYAQIDTCTVNGNPGTGCVAQKPCGQYLENACKINASGNDCKWTGSACIDKPCSDAEDSSLFDDDTKCQGFSNTCTLTQRKCSSKKATCAEYKNQAACLINTIGVTQQCQWTSNACSDATFSCASITGIGLTAGYCQKINNTCSVNSAGTACVDAQATCAGYTATIANCKWASTDKYCAVVGTFCVKDCSAATAPFNYDTCKAYSSLCTVKFDGSGCVGVVDTCANTPIANCTNSVGAICYNVGGTCTPASTALTTCANVSGGVNLTASYCKGISANACSVNAAQTACITKQDNCSGYTVVGDCFHAITDGDCYWTAAGACKPKSKVQCTDYAGTSLATCQQKKSSCTWTSPATTCSVDCGSATAPFDYDSCKAYDLSCTVKTDGSGCVAIVDTCANTASTLTNCTSSVEGLCYPTGTPSCQVATTALTTCTDINGKTRLTATYCKGISAAACSVLADQTGCIAKQNACSGYTDKAHCFSAINEPKCVVNGTNDGCIAFNDQTDACSVIKINGVTTYTDYHCQIFKTSCKAKTDGSGCEDKVPAVTPTPTTCSQFTGSNLTFYQCVDKLNTCSVNRDKNACVTAQTTCAGYTNLTECGYALNEGECVVSGTNCVPKTCDAADSSITTMAGCQTFSPNCVLRVGGCQLRASCTSYTVQGACVKSSTGQDCLWNATTAKCVDKTCAGAEASTNYNTHDKCAAVGNCTVKANTDKTVGQGCINRAACSSYVNSEQCKLNNATPAGACVWNANDAANPVCADKSCATAPLSTTTHSDCQAYFSNACTVDVVDVNGTPTPQGCVPLKPCSQYAEAQCHLSSEKTTANAAIECAWNGTACANKSCATAQSTVNTHALCSGYLSGCTVNATNDGCVVIPDKCEGMSKDQCFDGAIDQNSKKCYWVDDTTGCVTKTCENSPNYASETECDTYLSGCTTDAVKCKTKICEDFPLTTDALCKNALDGGICTSNGTNCVKKGTCGQAQGEAGCVTDSSNKLCQWMTPATGTAYCTIRTCNTAPNTLTTEEQCKQYFTPSSGSCTTKKDGGCTLKGACTAATVEAACKTDNTGADCWWDTDKCRLKECKDFSGSSHAACNKIRSNCTAGLNGKCALMANCEATTVRAACIQGNNGPCLWVGGACYSYESCKSLDWTSDSQCKKISPNCTTNGTECVGITSCAETNVSGGCKTGTDGQCIQTLSAKGAADTICKKYTSCDAAYYLTHDECQVANPNCTSDYANGCIPLAACSAYTKQGQCNFNKDGPIADANGGITSTGNCQWDETATACRDQQCKDLAYTTEYECAARLKTCSTDGTNCIVKGPCSSYNSDAACNKAGGTEGACFWVVATDTAAASCRTKTCADIPNGTSTPACSGVSNCVSNGTNCIVKATCGSYTTKTGCQSSGTDGLCVWTDPVAPATVGKCALMTGCASAKDDVTCNQASNRCSWNSTTKVCAEHTCDTYKTQVGSCRYFYTWDMKKYNVCSTVSGKCVATDAATLPEGDCYTLTAYQYSWNPTSSKCAQCGTVVPEPNNSNNSNSTNNGTTTDSGYILAWTSAVLAYLIM